MKQNKNLYTILAYDKFNDNLLNVFERMLIHQNINQGKTLDNSIRDKLVLINESITLEKWKVPEYRYNQDRMIEIYNVEKGRWEIQKKS